MIQHKCLESWATTQPASGCGGVQIPQLPQILGLEDPTSRPALSGATEATIISAGGGYISAAGGYAKLGHRFCTAMDELTGSPILPPTSKQDRADKDPRARLTGAGARINLTRST